MKASPGSRGAGVEGPTSAFRYELQECWTKVLRPKTISNRYTITSNFGPFSARDVSWHRVKGMKTSRKVLCALLYLYPLETRAPYGLIASPIRPTNSLSPRTILWRFVSKTLPDCKTPVTNKRLIKINFSISTFGMCCAFPAKIT